jgi:hypothetical protein
MREIQDVPVGGVRPGGAPVFEPGHQGVTGELAEGLPVTGDGEAPVGNQCCRIGPAFVEDPFT